MQRVIISESRFDDFVNTLRMLTVPPEQESLTHAIETRLPSKVLANCYLAIVAICHQTSPVGERTLKGSVGGSSKVGWDYLKEKFLSKIIEDPKWALPSSWASISSLALSSLYLDPVEGMSLGRVNERAWLLNNLGEYLVDTGQENICDAFDARGRYFGGSNGLAAFLAKATAFSDPVQKKTLFFASLASKECGWEFADPELIHSPVDYHELRGHLRMGTIVVIDDRLKQKVVNGLTLSLDEDTELRIRVQEVNDRAAVATKYSSSVVHYLCWNFFRECCRRPSSATHCRTCGSTCSLPEQYKNMSGYTGKCIFSEWCSSAGADHKVIDPPYLGHFY